MLKTRVIDPDCLDYRKKLPFSTESVNVPLSIGSFSLNVHPCISDQITVGSGLLLLVVLNVRARRSYIATHLTGGNRTSLIAAFSLMWQLLHTGTTSEDYLTIAVFKGREGC
jgi:hypothetical protein